MKSMSFRRKSRKYLQFVKCQLKKHKSRRLKKRWWLKDTPRSPRKSMCRSKYLSRRSFDRSLKFQGMKSDWLRFLEKLPTSNRSRSRKKFQYKS